MQFRSLKGTGEPRVASFLSCKHFQDRVPRWTKQQQKQSTREKVTFCKLKTPFSTNFVYKLQTFWGFCQVHFTILLQIQHENNFLPTSEHRQAKVGRFLRICLCDCFIYRTNFVFQKCLEMRRQFGCGLKTVSSQGYSELPEPIKTRENCFSLIW